jgi:hypothetical protein
VHSRARLGIGVRFDASDLHHDGSLTLTLRRSPADKPFGECGYGDHLVRFWVVCKMLSKTGATATNGEFAVGGFRTNSCTKPSLLPVVLFLVAVPASGTVTLNLSQGGGVAISGTSPSFATGYGNVNGLGVGAPGAGISILTNGVAGGVLYTTPYNIVISGMFATHKAKVTVYASAPFAHPTILYLRSCYPSGGCSSGSSYTTISTNAGAPTNVIAAPGVANNTYTASLALFVSNANGGTTFTGADTATLTFKATDLNNSNTSTVTLTLNSPNENVQTAVQFLLATAPSGVSISAGSDFSINFGNVNGLGISPGANLTTFSSAGGVTYGTPYLYKPSFSSFASTTCSVKVYISTDFSHPNALTLQDAAALAGPYTNISKSVGSQTAITTTATSGSSNTRYLGLFVSSANGVGAFPGTAGASGADSATLTYTLTVP